MDKKIILGIDPGSRVMGYGAICSDPLRLLDYGMITSREENLSYRYRDLFQGLDALVKQIGPDVLVVESQFLKYSVQKILTLGMAKGMAFLVAGLYDIPIVEYSPKEAKCAVTGHGDASKEQVQRMLQQRFRLPNPITPLDAADALALALVHYQRRG